MNSIGVERDDRRAGDCRVQSATLRPTRRVVLLGASNLVRSFSAVVETTRQLWREPVEIMAAIGHGRSYGQDSSVLGRKISGIFPCALWKDLQTRAPLPTVALMTDVGNDLLYGVPVERLFQWIDECVIRLTDIGATTIVTQLPIESIERLSEARFQFFRTMFFPRSRLPLPVVKAEAIAVNQELLKLATRPKTSIIPVSGAWYGFDPIHLKRSAWRQAWPAILSSWRGGESTNVQLRASLGRWAYLYCLAPSEQTMFGWRRCCRQPCGTLHDGTTISLY